MKFSKFPIVLCALLSFFSCNTKTSIKDAIDVANGVDRKPITISKTGVNAFGNDTRFGSISAQYNEVQNTLGLGFIRVLFSWNDAVQSSPDATPDFGLYDDIVGAIPEGMDVVVVLTHIPSWMKDPANWNDGDAGKTFVDRWVRKVVNRYKNNVSISAYQIWNEPNATSDAENVTMGFANSAANYVEMLKYAYREVKDIAPSKKVVSASTTSINQNYPDSLNYNKQMQKAEIEQYCDFYGVHYYGKQFEKVIVGDGVADYLNGIGRPIWVTESGAQGYNKQLAYVETAWPFLLEQIPGIERFYYYQFTEATDPSTTYGLRNLSTTNPTSDLYEYLRNQ